MKLKDIISISGKSGLYKILAKTKNGLIAESLEDKKRIPVFGSASVSALNDISVYTKKDHNASLRDVLEKLSVQESGGPAMDHNGDDDKLKYYFRNILPEYDEEQVYPSHIKKILKWYNQLQGLKLIEELLIKEEKQPGTEEEKDKTKSSPDKGYGAGKSQELRPKPQRLNPKSRIKPQVSKIKPQVTRITPQAPSAKG